MERKGVEKVHERFLTWILEVERKTPGYILRKEMQRKCKGNANLIRSKAGRRAYEFEERLDEGTREVKSVLARMCL